MSPGDVKKLEDVLLANNLPKVDGRLLKTFKLLGRREKKDFTPHDLVKLVEEIGTYQGKYKEEVEEMKNYLGELGIEKILTPVKSLSEFLEGDLKTADPKFFGSVVSIANIVETEHKKVTNVPVTGKIPWLKIVALLGVVGICIGIGYYVYTSGILKSIQIPGFGQATPADIMKKYPTPESLKAAIDRGELKYDSLPPDIKKMVDTVQLPAITATP